MASIIDTIKAKIDVVEEIGLVIALQKSGRSFKGLCPFHNERTPSFHVFAESQNWHCFGCNEGGDVFTFVQKQQGLEFRDALAYLAEKAGVSIEDSSTRSPEEAREASAIKERLRKLNEDALLWFHQMLLRSKDAAEARAYIQSRGISSDSVIAFGLGYAPNQGNALSSFLLGRGYTEHELVNGGLARTREGAGNTGGVGSVEGIGEVSGGVYDYFRQRIIFPIRDTRGRVIGFGGRALGDGQPKYLNSPQTVLFEKNSVLYALDQAKDAIKLAKQAIIVEGYVDAIIAHQYGTRQTVACIGSAITEKHIQQLKKLTKQVTLALDPDAAGATATEHGIQEALKAFDRNVVPVPLAADGHRTGTRREGKHNEPRGMIRLEEQVDAEINVLQLPPGQDPDEVIRQDFSLWSYAVAHPIALVDYYFVSKTANLDLRQPGGKTEAARRLLPVIAVISDRVKRDAYMRKLATMIAVDERSLHDELRRVLRKQANPAVTAVFSDPGRVRSIQGTLGQQRPITKEDGQDDAIEPAEPAEEKSSREGQEQRNYVLDRNWQSRLQWEDYLIGLLLQNPGLSQYVCGIINDGDFAGTDTRELYHILNSVYQRGSSPLHQSFEQYVPSALLATIARARESVESKSPLSGTSLVKDAMQCATRLKRIRLLQLNTELRYLMSEANEAGDAESMRQFQQQLLAIHRQLRTIDSAMHLHG
jgi:DNA primase